MPNLEGIRKDLARGLAVRVKRVSSSTPKGGPNGTQVELEAAEKDVTRATARLERAQVAHEVATREVQEYATALTNNGGTPELPEGFTVYTRPGAPDQNVTPVQDGEITDLILGDQEIVPAADGVDSAGDFTDPDRNGTANLDTDDGEPVDQRPKRVRRGAQV